MVRGQRRRLPAGLARNARLIGHIAALLAEAAAESAQTGKPAQRFAEFGCATLKSWTRERRVVAKAEQTGDKSNPRFVVTTLGGDARHLYEDVHCARGEMENRIKECQLDLFADCTYCEAIPRRDVSEADRGRHPARQPVAAG